MSWNNSKERKSFVKREQEMMEEYRRLGMSEEKIKEMYEFDLEVFNSDRKFYSNTCPLAMADDEEWDDAATVDIAIYHLSSDGRIRDDNSMSFDWTNEIRDEKLYNAIMNLPFEYREILRLIVEERQSQTEIAVKLNITQPAVSKKMKEIREIVGKAIGKV